VNWRKAMWGDAHFFCDEPLALVVGQVNAVVEVAAPEHVVVGSNPPPFAEVHPLRDVVVVRITLGDMALAGGKVCAHKAHTEVQHSQTDTDAAFVAYLATGTRLHSVHGHITDHVNARLPHEEVQANTHQLHARNKLQMTTNVAMVQGECKKGWCVLFARAGGGKGGISHRRCQHCMFRQT